MKALVPWGSTSAFLECKYSKLQYVHLLKTLSSELWQHQARGNWKARISFWAEGMMTSAWCPILSRVCPSSLLFFIYRLPGTSCRGKIERGVQVLAKSPSYNLIWKVADDIEGSVAELAKSISHPLHMKSVAVTEGVRIWNFDCRHFFFTIFSLHCD